MEDKTASAGQHATRRPGRRDVLTGALAAMAIPMPALAATTASAIEINQATAVAGKDSTQVAAAKDATSRMTVGVRLNDSGPYTFIVDTGANRSVVSAEAAATLGLPDAGPSAVHGIAGVEMADTVKVQSLNVGTVSSHDLTLPLLSAERLGAQGLLGIDVLKNRDVTLDFSRGELTIGATHGDLSSRSSETWGRYYDASGTGTVVVEARYRSGQLIIIDASVGDIPVQAFLDSGSEDTVANLALKTRTFERKPSLAQNLTSVELLSATGQVARGDLYPLPSLHIGDMTLDDVSAVFADLHTFEIWGLSKQPALLIGMDVLRRFQRVELDFGHHEVRFHVNTPSA